MMSEKQKMLAGELYFAADPELVGLRKNAARLTRLYNATTEEEIELRSHFLQELLGRLGDKTTIEPPFRCDYGTNIYGGDRLFINYNCVILDCHQVQIGNDVMFGPNVQLYTAYHPTDPQIRLSGLELAAPISISDNVWIGGGTIVCPGVTIGENTTIGAGSVVTKSIPAQVVAVGNPCRVIRELE